MGTKHTFKIFNLSDVVSAKHQHAQAFGCLKTGNALEPVSGKVKKHQRPELLQPLQTQTRSRHANQHRLK